MDDQFAESHWCTSACFVLLPIGVVLVFSPFLWILFGWLQTRCLKIYLKRLHENRAHLELHTIRPSRMRYGPWLRKAQRLLENQKTSMKSGSLQLGISLRFVLEELRPLYDEKTKHAEWRLHKLEPVTRSGFHVAVRTCGERGVCWEGLPACDSPADPHFHQVACLLAYGPHALGKGQTCPRDGLPDCSIVDALRYQNKSAKATWFLSWVWSYTLDTVCGALSSWWDRVSCKMGPDASEAKEYVWWSFFVRNQFRMLEAVMAEEPRDLFDEFGRQLEGIGRMIICLDTFNKSRYTRRIWCIFEVFVAVKRHIPITLAVADRDLSFIDTKVTSLQDIFTLCRVDSEKATASARADEDMIKRCIQEEHHCFQFVNEAVEQLLVTEVLQYLESADKAREVAVPSLQEDSSYFGVSLDFVLAELKSLYKQSLPRLNGVFMIIPK